MARIGETSERAPDPALGLVGHEVAAVGIGADRQRLLLEALQAGGLAVANVSVERLVVLGCGGIEALGLDAERGASVFEHQLVEHLLVGVERGIEARHLLLGQRIGAAAREFGELGVVAFLVALERALEFLERGGDVGGGGFGFGGGVEVGHQ